jgi:hypothetical protein
MFDRPLRSATADLNHYPETIERYMKLTLKAQAQFRSTPGDMYQMKYPKLVAFVSAGEQCEQGFLNALEFMQIPSNCCRPRMRASGSAGIRAFGSALATGSIEGTADPAVERRQVAAQILEIQTLMHVTKQMIGRNVMIDVE